MCIVKDRVQDSVLVVKMDVPLVVAEDVLEIVIQLVKALVRDVTTHVRDSAPVAKMDVLEIVIQLVNALVLAVVKVDVIQHVEGNVIICVQTGVVNVREDVPHTVHRVTGALAVGVHRIRILPVHAQEHVWAVV